MLKKKKMFKKKKRKNSYTKWATARAILYECAGVHYTTLYTSQFRSLPLPLKKLHSRQTANCIFWPCHFYSTFTSETPKLVERQSDPKATGCGEKSGLTYKGHLYPLANPLQLILPRVLHYRLLHYRLR